MRKNFKRGEASMKFLATNVCRLRFPYRGRSPFTLDSYHEFSVLSRIHRRCCLVGRDVASGILILGSFSPEKRPFYTLSEAIRFDLSKGLNVNKSTSNFASTIQYRSRSVACLALLQREMFKILQFLFLLGCFSNRSTIVDSPFHP